MIRWFLTKYHAWQLRRSIRLEAKARRLWDRHIAEWLALHR
jgi:hypothetical protein